MKKKIIGIIFILFLMSSFLLTALDLERDIIQRAHNLIGVPYVYGGESPSGFDCSGFIFYLFKDHLSSWPRGTRGQAGQGEAVAKEDLRPGDITFWATGSDPRRISHVSLYLGNDSMIHALSEGSRIGIAISSMNSRYWKPKYLFSRRIFSSAGITGRGSAQGDPPSPSQNEVINESQIYERIFPRGKYTGQLAGGKPEGEGRLELNNGSVYLGFFKEGLYHGLGKYTTRDGAVYEGEFRQGYLHGRAVRTWPSGSRYEGEYVNGRESGGWFTGQSGSRKWVVKKIDGSWTVTDGPSDSDNGPLPPDLSLGEDESPLEYVHRDNPWDDRVGTAYIPQNWESGDYFERVYQNEMSAFEAAQQAEQDAFEAYKNQ